ncbi:MAG: hypothetical protein HZC28_05505 [Spirochaetes bacterium]|nr:hypothetical protein [Spirochaetota bacterium]
MRLRSIPCTLLIMLVAAATLLSQSKMLDNFEKFDASAWAAKDNVQLSVVEPVDKTRGMALKTVANFEKFTYAWFRLLKIKAGDLDPAKYSGLSFMAKADTDPGTAITVTYLDDAKKEIRFIAGVTVSTNWQEFKVPFTALKKEGTGTAITDADLKKAVWITFSVGKKSAPMVRMMIDDLALMAK